MSDTCGAHAGAAADLRGTALHLLERVRVAVEPLRDADGEPPEPGSPGACRSCPVCAVLAVLRGERSELAAQLAEHAAGLVAVLAAVLEAEQPPPGRPSPGRPSAGPPSAGQPETGQPAAEPVRPVDLPRRTPGPGARVPSAHGRSVQRIAVHRR